MISSNPSIPLDCPFMFKTEGLKGGPFHPPYVPSILGRRHFCVKIRIHDEVFTYSQSYGFIPCLMYIFLTCHLNGLIIYLLGLLQSKTCMKIAQYILNQRTLISVLDSDTFFVMFSFSANVSCGVGENQCNLPTTPNICSAIQIAVLRVDNG